MTTQTYVWCALAGLLGMFAYVFIVKLPAAMTKAKVSNVSLSVKEYFTTEWVSMVGNLFSIAIALFIVGEVLKYKPELQGWIITIFAFYGFTGSSLLIAIFGQVNKRLNSIIDVKTNTSDAVTENPVTTIK